MEHNRNFNYYIFKAFFFEEIYQARNYFNRLNILVNDYKKIVDEEYEKLHQEALELMKPDDDSIAVIIEADSIIAEFSDSPNIFKNSSLVTIYSVLEMKLISLCTYLKSDSKESLSYNDLKGDSDFNKCKQYLIKVIEIDYTKEIEEIWENLNNYKTIRNAIIHNVTQPPKSLDPNTKKIIGGESRIDIKNNMLIILEDSYIIDLITLIENFFKLIMIEYQKKNWCKSTAYT